MCWMLHSSLKWPNPLKLLLPIYYHSHALNMHTHTSKYTDRFFQIKKTDILLLHFIHFYLCMITLFWVETTWSDYKMHTSGFFFLSLSLIHASLNSLKISFLFWMERNNLMDSVLIAVKRNPTREAKKIYIKTLLVPIWKVYYIFLYRSEHTW